MKIARLLLASLLVLPLMASCQNTLAPHHPASLTATAAPSPTSARPSTTAAAPAGFRTYTDPARYFSVSYPPHWEALPQGAGEVPVYKTFFLDYSASAGLNGLVFVFSASATGANLNIVVQTLAENEAKGWHTIEQIADGRIARNHELYPNMREHSKVATTIDGRKAIISEWENTEDGITVHRVIAYTIIHELVWKITCNIRDELMTAEYDNILAVINSLRILK